MHAATVFIELVDSLHSAYSTEPCVNTVSLVREKKTSTGKQNGFQKIYIFRYIFGFSETKFASATIFRQQYYGSNVSFAGALKISRRY